MPTDATTQRFVWTDDRLARIFEDGRDLSNYKYLSADIGWMARYQWKVIVYASTRKPVKLKWEPSRSCWEWITSPGPDGSYGVGVWSNPIMRELVDLGHIKDNSHARELAAQNYVLHSVLRIV